MEKISTLPHTPSPLNEPEIVFYYFSLTLEASFIISTFQMSYIRTYTSFYIQHFYKQHQAQIVKKSSKSQATP